MVFLTHRSFYRCTDSWWKDWVIFNNYILVAIFWILSFMFMIRVQTWNIRNLRKNHKQYSKYDTISSIVHQSQARIETPKNELLSLSNTKHTGTMVPFKINSTNESIAIETLFNLVDASDTKKRLKQILSLSIFHW